MLTTAHPSSLCRLCGATTNNFTHLRSRHFEQCPQCQLIQADSLSLPTRVEEHAEYLLHDNDASQPGYRRFLSPVANLALACLSQHNSKATSILDFGSGSGPTLSVMLGESGWVVQNYDPIFGPFDLPEEGSVNLLLCTEVVEHFHHPNESWSLLFSLISEGGCALVMTEWSNQYTDPKKFIEWRYIREQSHVCFYHQQTFRWLAKKYACSVTFHPPRVVMLQKQKSEP